MELIDIEEGGRFQVYTQFMHFENEAPFRVVLDPSIDNFNQIIQLKLNWIVGRYFKLLRDMVPNNSMEIRKQSDFFTQYSDNIESATQEIAELLSAYLHVKLPFRIIYDIVSQFNDFKHVEEPEYSQIGIDKNKYELIKKQAAMPRPQYGLQNQPQGNTGEEDQPM